jgi:hypothetical protein
MQEFWRLISFLTCLAGFIIVAGAMLIRGESPFTAAVRAIAVFIALWVALGILRAFVGIAAGPGPNDETPE